VDRGTEFLFEIHGETGDLQLTATSPASLQRQELKLKGAHGGDVELVDLAIPGNYRWVPEGVPSGSPCNVAQLYLKLAEYPREQTHQPGFDAAVIRYRLLDMMARASDTGMKQIAT
jgi:predicted dehydrogenase